jgi:hypothetical protein
VLNTTPAEEFVARSFEWNSGPAFAGPGQHLIPVPADVEPGLWRVCTVPDTPGLCAEFEVTADGAHRRIRTIVAGADCEPVTLLWVDRRGRGAARNHGCRAPFRQP